MIHTKVLSSGKAIGKCPALYCSAGRQSMTKNFKLFVTVLFVWDTKSVTLIGRHNIWEIPLSCCFGSKIYPAISWKKFQILSIILNRYLITYFYKRWRCLFIIIFCQRPKIIYIINGQLRWQIPKNFNQLCFRLMF